MPKAKPYTAKDGTTTYRDKEIDMDVQLPEGLNGQCLTCGEPFDVIGYEDGKVIARSCGHDVRKQIEEAAPLSEHA